MAEHERDDVVEHTGGLGCKPLPCFVHHEDAGGPCEQPSTMKVYGLPFCEAHGEEARIGAEIPSGSDHLRALERAYPNPPEDVREAIRNWELEEPGPTVAGGVLEQPRYPSQAHAHRP